MRAAPLLALVLACGTNPVDSTPDAGPTPDASTPVDAGPPPFDTCDAECRTHEVTFTSEAITLPFTQAAFGLTPPEKSDQHVWELYLEAWEGGFTGCPKQDSPTPKRTLILAGLALPDAPVTRTEADGVSATFLDFHGDVVTTPNPATRATAVSISIARANACAFSECEEADRFVALDLDLTFPEGHVRGHLVAPHCASFDD